MKQVYFRVLAFEQAFRVAAIMQNVQDAKYDDGRKPSYGQTMSKVSSLDSKFV